DEGPLDAAGEVLRLRMSIRMLFIRRPRCDLEHGESHQRAGEVDPGFESVGEEPHRAGHEIRRPLEPHRRQRRRDRQPGEAGEGGAVGGIGGGLHAWETFYVAGPAIHSPPMLQLEIANIEVGAQARSKEEAIRRVAGLLVRSGCIEPGYAESMLARERVANTFLGQGVAIPHGLPKDRELIRRTGIAVLQVPDGVEWQAGDIARIVVGIAAKSDEHIDILSNLTDLLFQEEVIARLAVTSDSQEIAAALSAAREEAAAPSADGRDFARSVEATVAGAHGLHARPATAFVELAKSFAAEVAVRHGAKTANGKSLAALLKL